MDLLFFVRCCHHVSPGYYVSSSGNEVFLLYHNGVLWLVHFDPRCSSSAAAKLFWRESADIKDHSLFPVVFSYRRNPRIWNSILLFSLNRFINVWYPFAVNCPLRFRFFVLVLKAKTIQSKNLFCELRWPPCKVIVL